MSATPPPCFVALGIEDMQAADERALRRAYATRLKQIDIDAQPDRFQALREALDQALQMLAWRDRARAAQAATAAPEPVSAEPAQTGAAPPSAAEAAPSPSAEQVGVAVFAPLQERVAAGLTDESSAADALAHALGDVRLLSIDARLFFEGNVARLLANGWQRGHEFLLGPAIAAFDWEADPTRLRQFGQVGALLAAAIRDRIGFRALEGDQAAELNRLIARMRDAVPPDPAQLRKEVPQLKFLVERFPNWLRIVSPVDPVNQRFEMWRQLPPAAPAPAPAPSPWAKAGESRTPMMVAAACIAALLAVLRLGGTASHPDAWRPAPTAAPLSQQAGDLDLARRQREAEVLLLDASLAASPAPARTARNAR